MPIIDIPINQGTVLSDVQGVADQQCDNMYTSNGNVISAPGYDRQLTYGVNAGSSIRGLISAGVDVSIGNAYTVSFNKMYEISVFQNGTMSSLEILPFNPADILDSGQSRVEMAYNSDYVVIVSDGEGYYYERGLGITYKKIVDPDFKANGDPVSVTFIDGYFAFSTDENKVIVSALNDPSSYNALDFASAEYDPDGIVKVVNSGNQLVVLGEGTIEFFRNIGGTGFPFQRVNGLFYDVGCTSRESVVKTDSAIYFIGAGRNSPKSVYSISGSSLKRVGNFTTDKLLHESSTTIFEGISYADRDSSFFGFNLGDKTMFIDETSGLIHTRTSNSGKFDPGIAINVNDRIVYGSSVAGYIGLLSRDIYTEAGNSIYRTITSQTVPTDGSRYVNNSVELIMETGDGDYSVALSFSDDGSKNFSDQRSRSTGGIGEYSQKIKWRRCGSFNRWRVFKLDFSFQNDVLISSLRAFIK